MDEVYLSTSNDLQREVFNTKLSNLLQQLLALLGILEDPGLDLLEHLGATTLNHVTEQSPGSAAEAVQRHAAIELLSGHGDGLVDVVQSLLDIDISFHDFLVLLVVRGHERVGEMGALLVDHNDLHAHGLRNDEDIGEDDGTINEAGVTINGLQSQGRGNLGRTTALEEVVGALGLVVLGQVATSLAHDPHGRAFDLLTTRSAQEQVVLHRWKFRHLDVGLVCRCLDLNCSNTRESSLAGRRAPRMNASTSQSTSLTKSFFLLTLFDP